MLTDLLCAEGVPEVSDQVAFPFRACALMSQKFWPCKVSLAIFGI